MLYSLTDAAKAVGRTRQALQMAIKKGTISAQKNALGQWEIDAAELHRVYQPIKACPEATGQNFHLLDGEKEAQIRELQARLESMERLATVLQRERDDWKQQADEWRMQAKALPAGEEAPRRGFWARLFGG